MATTIESIGSGIAKSWNVTRRFKPLRTAAQSAVALIGTNAVGLTDVDWVAMGSVSAVSAILSLLMAIADGSSLLAEKKNP